MRQASLFTSAAVFFLLHGGFSQQLTILDSSQKSTSFRGISVVSDRVFWISGSRGTVGRSTNGGSTITWLNPPGYENRDFRDVEALNSETALIMAVDSPGIILKTSDGGQSWREVYSNNRQGIFLDDMHFNGARGVCVGDAISGKMMVLRTANSGETWEEFGGPQAIGAEGCFAASGSNLLLTSNDAAFITGGVNARIHIYRHGGWQSRQLPIMQGSAMTGPNSLRALRGNCWVIVGGDYNNRLRSDSSWVVFNSRTKKAQTKHGLPYCSVVVPLGKKQFLAAGLSGWYKGQRRRGAWVIAPVNNTAAHTAALSTDNKTIFAAGSQGRIMKLELK